MTKKKVSGRGFSPKIYVTLSDDDYHYNSLDDLLSGGSAEIGENVGVYELKSVKPIIAKLEGE